MSDNLTARWPEAVSDGLTLDCGVCGERPRFDYRVTEEAWRELAPTEHRLSVVCLPCLDRFAAVKSFPLGAHVLEVQFIGTGYTIVTQPRLVHVY